MTKEEDRAFGQRLEQEERAQIAEAIRRHKALSPVARKLALYKVHNARSFAEKLADLRPYSIIIYSFSAAHAARTIAVMPSDIEKALLELIAAEILRTQVNRFNPSARDVAFMAKWTCDVFNAKVALESAASAVAEYTCNVADKKAELAAAVERADSPETRETAFYSQAKFAEQLAKSYATRLEDYRARVSADDEETWEAAVAAAIKARKARDVEKILLTGASGSPGNPIRPSGRPGVLPKKPRAPSMMPTGVSGAPHGRKSEKLNTPTGKPHLKRGRPRTMNGKPRSLACDRGG